MLGRFVKTIHELGRRRGMRHLANLPEDNIFTLTGDAVLRPVEYVHACLDAVTVSNLSVDSAFVVENT